MNVAPGVAMLDLPFEMMGTRSLIHPTVLWDADDVVLVDTGIPGATAPLREAAMRGVPLIDLRAVCDDDADFATPIEPSVQGGGKIAAAIAAVVTQHDFAGARCTIFTR